MIYRNDRFFDLRLSTIRGTEDYMSTVSVAAGFGPISLLSAEWTSNPERVEAARLASFRGGVTSHANSAAAAVQLSIFCADGITGDAMGLCLIGNGPPRLVCWWCVRHHWCATSDTVVCLRRGSGHGQRTHGHHRPHSAGAGPPRSFGLWNSFGVFECRERCVSGHFFERRGHG